MSGTALDDLLRHLPELAGKPLAVSPIERGGSDRQFYRIEGAGAHPLILIRYGEGREENRHYVTLARFLETLGIHVPRVLFHDPADRVIGMEDLGERDLWSFRDAPWEVLRPLYEAALRQVILLHARGHLAPEVGGLPLQVEFDAALYRWEQRYFFEHCAKGVFGRDRDAEGFAPLGAMAESLAALPRSLVHRDFQSQNILVCDGETHLIDFQGLRWGLPHYDVASLLFDPYVALARDRREELLAFYEREARREGVPLGGDFPLVFRFCAAQRLMQALGAYGFLGLVKGRDRFLSHIPVALPLLREVVEGLPGFAPLSAFLEELGAAATGAGAGRA